MAVDPADIRVGTAGWSMPPALPHGPVRASALERYGRLLPVAEVNSSFYRHHRSSTWARWAASTPDGFRFSVKLPRTITHLSALEVGPALRELDALVEETSFLGDRLGPLLVQLPPSRLLDMPTARPFLAELRARWPGHIVLEPRHATWFGEAAAEMLARHRIARVAADPATVHGAALPGGFNGIAYFRLHGSPRMYWSRYEPDWIEALADRIRTVAAGPATEVWCIFDNTAGGAAIDNALELRRLLTGAAEDGAEVHGVGRGAGLPAHSGGGGRAAPGPVRR